MKSPVGYVHSFLDDPLHGGNAFGSDIGLGMAEQMLHLRPLHLEGCFGIVFKD